MRFKIKKYLIQEGITDFVKNNWGKGLVAASGLVMANAGVFGDQAQKAVEMGGEKLNTFVKDAGDWSKKSFEKLEQKYGDNGNNNHSQQNNQNNSNQQVQTNSNDTHQPVSNGSKNLNDTHNTNSNLSNQNQTMPQNHQQNDTI